MLEPNDDGFVRAVFRVIATNLLPSAPSEIVRFEEGARQYDTREGFNDVGVSHIGIQFKEGNIVVIGFAQIHQHAAIAKKRGETKNLIVLCQHKETEEIYGWLFTNVELVWNQDGPPKGEASMLPAHFRYDEVLSVLEENLEVVGEPA